MDIKKIIIIGAALVIIALLFMPQSPVKIMGLAQPIGVAGYVRRTNNAPMAGAVVSVGYSIVTADANGRYVGNGVGQDGGTIVISASSNNMYGSTTLTIDLSKPTQWANVTIGQITPDFSYIPQNPKPNETMTFSDASSGPIISWRWDFGDGTTSTQKNPTHMYTKEKTYTVTDAVTDDLGTTKILTKNIIVKTPTPPMPKYTLTIITKQKNCFVSLCQYFPLIPQGEGSLSCQAPKNSGNGTIQFNSLTSGRYTISAGKEGYTYKTMTVDLTSDKIIEIDLSTQEVNMGMYIFMGAFIASFLLILIVIIRKKKK